MTEQEMVDQIAIFAKSRLAELLKLKVEHVYDPIPGDEKSILLVDGLPVPFKFHRSVQPYKDIERFMKEDKLVGFLVNPGILPIAKAIALDARGHRALFTRRVAARSGDQGAEAHLDGFGVRVKMHFVPLEDETHVVWECIYGVV